MTVVEYWEEAFANIVYEFEKSGFFTKEEMKKAGVGKGMPHTGDCKWLAWKRG